MCVCVGGGGGGGGGAGLRDQRAEHTSYRGVWRHAKISYCELQYCDELTSHMAKCN